MEAFMGAPEEFPFVTLMTVIILISQAMIHLSQPGAVKLSPPQTL
ncbi:hypothetical protein ALP98_101068 [Pseudomonas viridiflava]|uniref:Uncharacterized protein n=3 Tax=Pseudomonas syringae group TaxID=136849 RepID=A0A7Z6UN13_PSESF|nr:hypothetical protein ALQ30_100797 [Pseudomonas syringae pv. persicae]RMP78083.1 hypothetical protein ALQ15_104924 [Pseudomonas syringae pv. actinidiae]RMQ11919.1 hypothetical protein ALQ09_100706 [Pseudomonas viridiflava]RMQ76549.1 hypothetical protein ALP98_101068 [Pseudomonas viridiflava]RMR61293.1 hypothetical protein ALP83_100650 [Pseudomonas syringae pv. actinidiae]